MKSATSLYSDFNQIIPFKAKYGEYEFELLNALEDLRVEKCMIQEYPGARENLKAAYRDAMSKWEQNAPPVATVEPNDRLFNSSRE